MNFGVPGELALLYVLWVCTPMIPAVLIYGLFPKDKIGVKGPLGQLTISATGAFAAYIIVVVITYPIVYKSENAVGTQLSPMWEVTTKVRLENLDGTEANPSYLQGLAVELRPDFYHTANQYVTVFVPEINKSLPDVVFRVPNFGSGALNIDE